MAPTVIYYMLPVWFDKLMELHLYYSQLNSIQFVSFLNAPNLSNLGLGYNNITIVKSLNKAVLKNIIKLGMPNNKLKRIDL